ncbi:hypothetical protein BZG36_04849 [Bifiguratus adelaidae]|uniref:Uncharacterized protein n=1 Tax=Bifiguratus adelaidae TaxID=1938954 RepID=A0A261XVU4_9FUNG|nr:hypothetical protein BZG36_04849 [Bifiguratus adelaidae]
MEDINNVGQKILGNRLWRAYGPTARLFATEIQSDNNTELTALAPCKVVDIKDEQLNLDAADAMDTTCNSVKADKQAVSDSLADVPGVWLKLFSFEIPIVLFTCGYWICAPSHYLQAMFNVTESPAAPVEEARAIKDEENTINAYMKHRYTRSVARTQGVREKLCP